MALYVATLGMLDTYATAISRRAHSKPAHVNTIKDLPSSLCLYGHFFCLNFNPHKPPPRAPLTRYDITSIKGCVLSYQRLDGD